MISEKMKVALKNSSAIREMFEEGRRLSKEYGEEEVFDFSLGNPNLPAPQKVKDSILEIVSRTSSQDLHGYSSNQGYEEVREAIAHSLNQRFQTRFQKENICMTVGAAGGLNVLLKLLLNPGEEVITFLPYFPEYRGYIDNFGGKMVEVPPKEDFQPDLKAFRAAITEKTKAVFINTPNNPTGVVYTKEVIQEIAKILLEKQEELGNAIYLISDEPYRELVYDGVQVPYLTHYYPNTLVVYSYSKTLSLPGERIGYVVIPEEATDGKLLIEGFSVAMRMLGFVNAPTLQQKVIAQCLEESVDVSCYEKNRNLLYSTLTKMGFQCVKPEGAFYLFLKSPIEEEKEFCKRAKEEGILMVPGSAFGWKGYVRIAYCVSHQKVEKSLEKFQTIAQYYQLQMRKEN